MKIYRIAYWNYEWLEIYPDNEKYAITAMFDNNKNIIEWYFDMIKERGIEEGIPYIDDLLENLTQNLYKEFDYICL